MHRSVRMTAQILGLFIVGGMVIYLAWRGVTVIRFYFGPSETTLAETGFDWAAARGGQQPDTYPFAPSYPFWSDGAVKERFVYLPPDSKIDATDPDRWNFPQGTRLWKVFSRDEQHVETRMLFKYGPEAWAWDMAVYQPDPVDGVSRKLAVAKENVAATEHDIPAPSDCVSCHGSGNTRRPLGLTAIQLPWSMAGSLSHQQLIQEGRVQPGPEQPYVIPGNSLEQAALGYFDTNCGSCHLAGSTFVSGKVPLQMNLTTKTLGSVAASNVYQTTINKAPHLDGMGLNVYVIPGDPEKSFLWRRMSVRDDGIWQMPPIATERIDERGDQLIREWILGLEP